MSQKMIIRLFIACFVLMSFSAGCTEQMSLSFDQGGVSTYKFVSETTQDFKFEQLSAGKKKVEQNKTLIKTVFDQQIIAVNEDASADAKVTLKEIKILVKNPEGVVLDFDSTRPSDRTQDLRKLVGQSYTIQITPDGKAKPINVKQARNALTAGPDRNWAKNFLSDKEIVRRHEVVSMPSIDESQIKKGGNWTTEGKSHPRMLEQKTFEKVYTVDNISDKSGRKVATISMEASPSGALEGVAPGTDFSFMAKMFDTKENYNGQVKFDIESGRVISMNEKMAATYTASEMPKGKPDAKGPDTLIMGLTYQISLEQIK